MARMVYSSEKGRICPKCGHPVGNCRCSTRTEATAGDGIVRVRRETKGRKGKTVTVVTGLPVRADELKKLASTLKRRCGSGGTSRAGIIEIQGDHVGVLVKELEGLGYTVRKSG